MTTPREPGPAAPEVHPTALLEGDVELAPGVRIGPGCVIRGPVRIAAGTRLLGQVWLRGPLVLGARNLVYPFCALGFAPQHLGWDPDRDGAGLVIGDDNTFRESVTVSRAASDEAPTRVGDHNYWMASSHAGHDCQVGSRCVIANGVLLGGAVEMGDGVIVGGNVSVHQHTRLGRGSLLSGSFGINRDLPPFFMLTGPNICGSFNLTGMRRAGMSHDEIDDVRWVFKTLYRKGLAPKQALAELEGRAERPLVAEYIAFLGSSKRGICPHHGDVRRGTSAD